MAQGNGIFYSMDVRGSLGNALTARQRFGRNIVSAKILHNNSNTPLQASTRLLMKDLAAAWSALTDVVKGQWTAAETNPELTGYNRYQKAAFAENDGSAYDGNYVEPTLA